MLAGFRRGFSPLFATQSLSQNLHKKPQQDGMVNQKKGTGQVQRYLLPLQAALLELSRQVLFLFAVPIQDSQLRIPKVLHQTSAIASHSLGPLSTTLEDTCLGQGTFLSPCFRMRGHHSKASASLVSMPGPLRTLPARRNEHELHETTVIVSAI